MANIIWVSPVGVCLGSTNDTSGTVTRRVLDYCDKEEEEEEGESVKSCFVVCCTYGKRRKAAQEVKV